MVSTLPRLILISPLFRLRPHKARIVCSFNRVSNPTSDDVLGVFRLLVGANVELSVVRWATRTFCRRSSDEVSRITTVLFAGQNFDPSII